MSTSIRPGPFQVPGRTSVVALAQTRVVLALTRGRKTTRALVPQGTALLATRVDTRVSRTRSVAFGSPMPEGGLGLGEVGVRDQALSSLHPGLETRGRVAEVPGAEEE